MQEIFENITQARCGGAVQRCHTIRHNGSYNNAEHSWGVAMLMYYLYPKDYNKLSIYCLTHDLPEAWIGDIPATTTWVLKEIKEKIAKTEDKLLQKIGCPPLSDLSDEELSKLKSCDKLELYLWSIEQINSGNFYALDCRQALDQYFKNNKLEETAERFYNYLFSINISPSLTLPNQRDILKEVQNDN